MYTIYEYAHFSACSVTIAYLAAQAQPLAGGADVAESARLIPPVHRVDDLEQARAWIKTALPAAFRRLSNAEYEITEQRHSQAELCISACAVES